MQFQPLQNSHNEPVNLLERGLRSSEYDCENVIESYGKYPVERVYILYIQSEDSKTPVTHAES